MITLQFSLENLSLPPTVRVTLLVHCGKIGSEVDVRHTIKRGMPMELVLLLGVVQFLLVEIWSAIAFLVGLLVQWSEYSVGELGCLESKHLLPES